MSEPAWFLAVGSLLIFIVLSSTLLARLSMSGAMAYLFLGALVGPGITGLIDLDPLRQTATLELLAEIAVLISLFTVGLRMGIPLRDRRWVLPIRLALVSMVISVTLIAALAVWGLGMSPGEGVLLGAILAPTDPVLASGIQTERGPEPTWIRFALSGEGGLNDGTAFPFVLLGLGLMGHYDLGDGGWRWIVVDLMWGTIGGLAIGAMLGLAIGRVVIYMRTRHAAAVGHDEFLTLGLIALAYGMAQLCVASGFLAVFAAGLALQRVDEAPQRDSISLGSSPKAEGHGDAVLGIHSHHASATMARTVRAFNAQLERFAELALVLLVGAMLAYIQIRDLTWWFVPVLFVFVRPVAVFLGTIGSGCRKRQRASLAWFGIRGIGSVFYLFFAIRHGIDPDFGRRLVTITLSVVAASILLHGASVKLFMSKPT
ncbi:sodium:proton antiporter [Bordetella sp. N]|nr:sodium:proton antiporter [Bordetella sp. N]